MTSWADGKGQAFQNLNDAPSGTGATLPGQHALTPEERRTYNQDQNDFNYREGVRLQGFDCTAPGANDAMKSGHRIGQASDEKLWGSENREEYLKAAQQQSLGDVNDPQARLKAMSFITQDKPKDPNMKGMDDGGGKVDQSVCAGASIVGAAYLAEGPEGLKSVMKAIEAADPKHKSTGSKNPEYTALKEKLAKNPNSLTVADIQALQNATYEVLREQQRHDPDPEISGSADSGIHGKTMDKFMAGKGSKELDGMLKKNGMQLEGVDIDGKLDDQGKVGMEHWVVRMKGPDGKEGESDDPLARRGGQVIDFDEGVKHYENARQDIVGD